MSESFLTKQRGYKRAQITKLHRKVYDDLESFNLNKKTELITKLEQLDRDIRDLDDKINSSAFDDEDKIDDFEFDRIMTESDSYTNKIIESLVLLRGKLTPVITAQNVGGAGASNSNTNNFSKLKLPEIPLPYYSHNKDESLESFLNTFASIVDKYSISSYEKFFLLKGQLKGEPLTLINSLPAEQQSYDEAKGLLEQAFADVTIKKFDALSRLCSLKVDYSGNVYEYVGEMRTLQSMLTKLKVELNDVLQFFFWNGMNCGLQSQLVNICNNNKPSLDDINNNIFKAIDRYLEVNKRYKAKKDKDHVKTKPSNVNVNTYAADVSAVTNKKIFCSLCSAAIKVTSHSTSNCPVYQSVESKLKRLNSLGACNKCGYANHNTSSCKFDFKRKCFHCSADHMGFLCTNADKALNDKNAKEKTINSSVVCTSALKVSLGNDVLLPTFSCNVGKRVVRGLKDSGSQTHFIKTDIADKLCLHVIRNNLTVSINGFNETINYVTKMVELPLSINGNHYKLDAICIPDIRTKMYLPGMTDIARSFVSKGYCLADSFLSDGTDRIDNIEFILGNKNPEILLEKQIKFGSDNVTVYSETDAGILLYGNIDLLSSNLNHLPDISSNNVSVVNNFSCNMQTAEFDVFDSDVASNFNSDINISYSVLDNNILNEDELSKALSDILNYDSVIYREDGTEVNTKVVNYILDNTTRDSNGRLIMPLPWRGESLHYLSTNYNLSLQILKGNMHKISQYPDKLKMMHNVFVEQLNGGIIERVPDLNNFLKGDISYSFLPHMGIFKYDRATTKCRVVFLSNLCEKTKNQTNSFSHNQTMYAGPSLNQKLTTAIMHLRFGEKLLTYDLKKAFNQISLYENDTNKLLFLWFKDPLNGDFSPIAYRNVRLSFGLRASSCILMLALYKLLCLDVDGDSQRIRDFKKLLYALLYMDNGAFTGTAEEVSWAYDNIKSVFGPYKFDLQQITSNFEEVQNKFDSSTGEITPDNVKLLGLYWDRLNDQLMVPKIELDIQAETKRQILQSIAGQYDVFNIQGPIINRARIFLHKLQCDKDLSWDSKLDSLHLLEWKRIVKQANASPCVKIDRFVGNRHDDYELYCFTDASSSIYAAVIYLKNVSTGKISFLRGLHRLVNKQLSLKTIPSLELQALTLGVEGVLEVKKELSGEACIYPISIVKVRIFCDSMICLHWLNSYTHKLDKMKNQSVFVMNRLEYVSQNCNSENPIIFSFVPTNSNVADCLSRAISYKTMVQANYIDGPDFLHDSEFCSLLDITVPNPSVDLFESSECTGMAFAASVSVGASHLVSLERFSTSSRYIRVHLYVLKFIELLRRKRSLSNGVDYSIPCHKILSDKAFSVLISNDQKLNFLEEYDFLNCPSTLLKDIPPLISRVNLFLDTDGMLKVKSKFDRFSDDYQFPILLSKNSLLTKLIIRDHHEKLSHMGLYALISKLRKKFFIEHMFSTVKKILKDCTLCQRMNGRAIKLNQSSYRDFRVNPPCIPFQFLFLDYLGPFMVKVHDQKVKVWLLLLTCLWSRNISIKVCKDLTVSSFLKSFQAHVYEEGLPAKVFSDLGSQITVAGDLLKEFLNDVTFESYFSENNIKPVKFHHYFKGESSLGSMVEICVKFVKKTLFGSIRNNVLERDDFDLLICKTVYLLNSRPIAFKSTLRSNDEHDFPEPLTPELLKKGRNLQCINVVPALRSCSQEDPDWSPGANSGDKMFEEFAKLRKVQSRLIDIYNEEFMDTLLIQAVDKNDRYQPIQHNKLCEGDIVLLKEPLLKFHQFPMAVVMKIYENYKGEVSDVELFKGKTREVVKRHVTAVVPYLKNKDNSVISHSSSPNKNNHKRVKYSRKAADISQQKTKAILMD